MRPFPRLLSSETYLTDVSLGFHLRLEGRLNLLLVQLIPVDASEEWVFLDFVGVLRAQTLSRVTS